jgi:hypothetical protein
MTMIAFNVRPNRVDVLTDSVSYTTSAHEVDFDRSEKVHPIEHLPGVVITQGPVPFGDGWRNILAEMAPKPEFTSAGFAELASLHETLLPDLWDAFGYDGPHDTGTVFLVGYDAASKRMSAVGFFSTMGFAAVPLEEFFVMPPPLDVPQRAVMRTGAGVAVSAVLDVGAPSNPAGWASFAQTIRRQRGHAFPPPWGQPGEKVLVGGTVTLTSVTARGIRQDVVHRFEEDDQALAQLMAGTIHPAGQAAPCPCGSARSYAACHLTQHLDEPCLCRSGATLADCCYVPEAAGTPVMAGTARAS